MTADELVLVAAVSATPADDTPRLVYADWLDEHAGTVDCFCKGRKWKQPDPCHRCNGRYGLSDGRRERAEFIRVQCEIATVGPTDSVRGKLDTEKAVAAARRAARRDLIRSWLNKAATYGGLGVVAALLTHLVTWTAPAVDTFAAGVGLGAALWAAEWAIDRYVG